MKAILLRICARPGVSSSFSRTFSSSVSTRQADPCKDVPSFPFKRPREAEPPVEYAELLKRCPMSRVKLWDGSSPWLVVSHKGVTEVLSTPVFSHNRTLPNFPEMGPGGKEAAKQRATFVDMDPPEHTRHRGMIEYAFAKDRIDGMRGHIQRVADEALEGIKKKKGQPVDLITTYAADIPMVVICDMLGLPREDIPFFNKCTATRASGSNTATEAAQASNDLLDYIGKKVDAAAKAPKGNDITSRLVHEYLLPKKIEREDAVGTVFLLLVAGNATVTGTIALGVYELLKHPEQLAALKKDPSLWEGAVEEVCRYHTASAYATRRVAKADVTLEGQRIRAGEAVIAAIQAANRDPVKFPNPDKFDIRRNPNPEVGFGVGIHVCVAEWLARAELQIALKTLLEGLPSLKIESFEFSAPEKDVGFKNFFIKW